MNSTKRIQGVFVAIVFVLLQSQGSVFGQFPTMPSPIWTAESNQAGASMGESVRSAGDVNGDGYADVIVGAPYYDNGQLDEGAAFLYLGSASGLGATPAWTAESNQPKANFGISVSTAGDVNGDGYDDVIVGAPVYDTPGANPTVDAGRVFVYLGSASGLKATPDWIVDGPQGKTQFGYSVSTAGDVNGDGYDDVIVGAYLHDGSYPDVGHAFVYLGSASGLSPTAATILASDSINSYFGYSVSTAGDVNGDGFSDVIVGAPDFAPLSQGRMFLHLGSASGVIKTPALIINEQPNALFGHSVAWAGDVNGDGYDDVIVGAPNYGGFQYPKGRARIYHGSAAGLSGTAASIVEGDVNGVRFGFSCSSAGDINGDGYDDVIVGGPSILGVSGQTKLARACIYLGSANGVSTTPVWKTMSNQIGTGLGASVDAGGDVNGDGIPEVLVGARKYDNGQTDEGAVFAFSPAGNDVDGDGWGDSWDNCPFHFNADQADGNGNGLGDVCEAEYSVFGSGLPGCNGPHHVGVGSHSMTAGFQFYDLNAPPNSTGLLLISSLPLNGSYLFGWGIPLYVDQSPHDVVKLDMQSNSLGQGFGTIPPLNNPSLIGNTYYAQSIWFWSGPCSLPPLGLSASKGIQFTVQP